MMKSEFSNGMHSQTNAEIGSCLLNGEPIKVEKGIRKSNLYGNYRALFSKHRLYLRIHKFARLSASNHANSGAVLFKFAYFLPIQLYLS